MSSVCAISISKIPVAGVVPVEIPPPPSVSIESPVVSVGIVWRVKIVVEIVEIAGSIWWESTPERHRCVA